MQYFYYTDEHDALIVIRSDNPAEEWTPIPKHLENAVFACIANDVPFRVNGNVLDLGEAKPKGAVVKWDWVKKAWIDSRSVTSVWMEVRSIRDGLLSQSDWTQLPDVPLATKEAWATYRQALRDITSQPDPFAVLWPVKPGN